MSLVFYYAPWSSATTCLWAIEELELPCEKVKLDLLTKATHTPEFLAMNPNGKVPLLVHDGVPIWESIAILAHLGETFGVEKKLFPGPGIERAQALQWLAWMNVTLAAAVYKFISNTSDQIPADMRNAKVGEVGKGEVEKLIAMLANHLEGKTWMVGDTFTFVDAHLAGALMWIGRMGFDTKKHPQLDAWFTRCQARPALARVMKA
ncbi:MAG: Glutathione S-transferase [Myxococcaceae bacterium]|nr:Glutathione S-transferase [Myxococcaceae bacterium]